MDNDKNVVDMYEKMMDGIFSKNDNEYPGDSFNHDSEDFITSADIIKFKKNNTSERCLEDGVIEESINYKRYTKRRDHKYTNSEMDEIKRSCNRTIVHDYGEYDIFHMSDEDRSTNDHLSSISIKLLKLKRTYRRLDQYIEAMRVVFEAWTLLEKVNYVHTRDEFFQMVAEGKIISNRIIIPKLKRIDRFNMDMIINYVSNPELDISHLIPKSQIITNDSFFSDESDEERRDRLLSKEEILTIEDKQFCPDKLNIEYFKPKYIKGYDKINFNTFSKNKLKKHKISKKDLRIKKSISEILTTIQNNNTYQEYGSYSLTKNLFEPEKKVHDIWETLKFNGSWRNNNDVKMYELMLNEELLNQKHHKDWYVTYGDKELQQFFRTLEDNGISTLDLRKKMNENSDNNGNRHEKIDKKHQKNMEKAIMQRLTKLNENPKFKKIINKAEAALNKYMKGE